MKLEKVETERAPKAIGPYSQAVKAFPYLFVSGMLPIESKKGEIGEKTIEEQTRRVLENIGEILKAQGLNFESVVRMEVYLRAISDFGAMNRVYGEYFPHPIKPARHAIGGIQLPLDALVEMTCTAVCR